MSWPLALLGLLALGAGGVALLVFRASPKAAFVIWMLVLCFVPVWIGATAGFFWAAITAVTLVAIAANLRDLRLSVVDAIVALFVVLVVALFALQLASLAATVIAVLEWVVPYLWGRLVLTRLSTDFVTRVIAAVATAVAVVALVEFATGVNVFVGIPGPGPYAEWSTLQPRASFVRAEGAFGHSIALGASLAMAAPFIVAARWRAPLTLLALALAVGAIVVTFSRIGIVTVGIAVALSLLLLPDVARGARWAIGVGGAIAIAMIVPFIGGVFTDAGDEAGGSADYRTGLLTLVSEVQLLGSAGDWSSRTVDGTYLGTFARSVDNTLLLIGLRFGWLPVLLVLAVFAAIALGALRRRSDPATIAVVSQIPALFAVALITQFGMLLWFLIGLSVAWRLRPTDAGSHGADEAGLAPPVGLSPPAPVRLHRGGVAP
ncbi:hypothetical protein AA0Z99_03125 [Agrococcus sp. 1P02AA]|uniref:hypothetical protein n=1 Tax=Agrococcus sp. 1P02AA TaxID=3132259 RepID=UPI0039A7265F